MKDRVYVEKLGPGDSLSIHGDELRHLARVKRLAVGDPIEVFDGLGQARHAVLTQIDRNSAIARLEGPPVPSREPVLSLTLATAVPKGERFDWLVEKAVELGVARLIPLRTERSVVDPRSSKLDRLRRTVIEASKQCGRNRLMELAEPATWPQLLAHPEDSHRWFAHPGGETLYPLASPVSGAILAIGPEGGFTEFEASQAREAGWRSLGLGPTILRIETAAIAASAVLLLSNQGNSA